MAMKKQDIVALGKALAKAESNVSNVYSFNGQSLSYEALDETFRRELNELAGTYSLYRENKNLIFSIIEEVLDEVLPKKVTQQYEDFAETRVFAQGDKPSFRRKITNNSRAKQFVTRVGLAGIYEVFKLGKGEESFEVRTSAIGGAAEIGFEEYLDGRVDFAELLNVILEGMDDLIYKEIGEALKASINQLPPVNTHICNGFDEDAMDRLITIASAYGTPTIYCTHEFAVKMVPQEAWRYTENMKSQLWQSGRLADYKGTKVVVLEQGFEDGTNSTKVIDPGYVYIIPTGADKPVKIAFEGNTIVDEFNNYDRSREVQVYKKVGVVAMMSNNICAYIDTSLAGKMSIADYIGRSLTIKDYTGEVNTTNP